MHEITFCRTLKISTYARMAACIVFVPARLTARLEMYVGVSMHVRACVSMDANVPTYPQAKVKEEEDVEGHIDL